MDITPILSNVIQAFIVLLGCVMIPLVFNLVYQNDAFFREEIKAKERHLRKFASDYSPAIGYYYKYAARTMWLMANKDSTTLSTDGLSYERVTVLRDTYFDKHLKYTPYEVILKTIELDFEDEFVQKYVVNLTKLTDELLEIKLNDPANFKNLYNKYQDIRIGYDELFNAMAKSILKMKHQLKEDRLKLDVESIVKYFLHKRG